MDSTDQAAPFLLRPLDVECHPRPGDFFVAQVGRPSVGVGDRRVQVDLPQDASPGPARE